VQVSYAAELGRQKGNSGSHLIQLDFLESLHRILAADDRRRSPPAFGGSALIATWSIVMPFVSRAGHEMIAAAPDANAGNRRKGGELCDTV
jgi:hypothetical protein